MKIVLVTIFAVLGFSVSYAQEVTVFKSGTEGYASYRIPAIIKDGRGNLLAFSEGRVDGAGDYGNVDIVYKISKDGGRSWGDLKVAADYDKLQAGNAAPVVDLLDPRYPKGRIFLFYNTGNNHEGEIRKRNGIRELWYISSLDGGESWSEPVNITTSGHRPLQPKINPAYNFKEDWRAFANTPGHAIQLNSGPYKGRLYIPSNHSTGEPRDAGKDYFAGAYYSDDHGKTFQLAQTITFEGGNETMAAQVSETDLYMNSRNQQGQVRSRIVSYSSDGGVTWDTTFYDKNLPDPVNQGSTLSWRNGKKYTLAVCNAADAKNRDNLTLRISNDRGKTWYIEKVIAKAAHDYNGDWSAYSDIVLLKKKTIGVLYEKDNYREIVFVPVKIN